MTNDPRQAIQFPTKKRAVAAAKAIHWLSKDVSPIEIMGFQMWTISDDHRRFLTRSEYFTTLAATDAAWR